MKKSKKPHADNRRNSERRNLRHGDVIMAAIVAEMDARGMTAYGLAKLVGAPPTAVSVYEYLRGESAATTPVASRLLTALMPGVLDRLGEILRKPTA